MAIKDKVAEAISKQINAELYSAYLYLAMAAYLGANHWPGFGRWMKLQAKEENAHAMKLFDYVLAQGGRIGLEDIKASDINWNTPLEVFEAVYKHEQKVSALINELVKVARNENDADAESMLKWFVDEQVEEEASAQKIIDKLKPVKGSTDGLSALDCELGQRK